MSFLQFRSLRRRVDAALQEVEPLQGLARLLHRQKSFDAAEGRVHRGDRKAHAETAAFAEACVEGKALDRIAAELEELDGNDKVGFLEDPVVFRVVACIVRREPTGAGSRLKRCASEYPGLDTAESDAIGMAWIQPEKLEKSSGAAERTRAFPALYRESGYRPLAEGMLRQAEGCGK